MPQPIPNTIWEIPPSKERPAKKAKAKGMPHFLCVQVTILLQATELNYVFPTILMQTPELTPQ